MELAICHLHGRAGIVRVCSHIREALRTGATVPAWQSYPWLKDLKTYVVLRFCSVCVAHERLPVPARTLHEHELDVDRAVTQPMCEACFAASSSEP